MAVLYSLFPGLMADNTLAQLRELVLLSLVNGRGDTILDARFECCLPLLIGLKVLRVVLRGYGRWR